MNRKSVGRWIGILGLLGAGIALMTLESCARSQKLVGITISPASFTFLQQSSSLSANFSALGTYIHPPETKDITSQVTWSSDVPQMVTVAGGVVAPTGNACGVVNVSASYNQGTEPGGNLVIGYSTVTVENPLIASCPGGTASPILSVLLESNTSTGDSVTSSPFGINCPSQSCGAPFVTGTSVSLTALPAANFVSWGTTCPGASANICIVDMTASTTVTAIFQ